MPFTMVACGYCGRDLESRSRNPRKWCSQNCRVRAWEQLTGRKTGRAPRCAVSFHECASCGELFSARPGGLGKPRSTCSKACLQAHRVAQERDRIGRLTAEQRDRRNAKRREYAAVRRAQERGAEAEQFKAVEIFDRDDWSCGICTETVDPNLRHPDPWRASLDHVIPLARGGQHTRSNTRCSHLICNIRRGHRDVAA